MFVLGTHAFAMFYAHPRRGIHATYARAHNPLTTFTIFEQNFSTGCLLAVLCIQLDYVVVSGKFIFYLVCDLKKKNLMFKTTIHDKIFK
jgi:hypothetical protein